jgi:hypothetical protein
MNEELRGGIIEVRKSKCAACVMHCEKRNTIPHEDLCASCPRGVWFEVGCRAPLRGLGDAVALVAQPIARMIDAATGHRTNVASCGGCKARQAALNKALPFIQS